MFSDEQVPWNKLEGGTDALCPTAIFKTGW